MCRMTLGRALRKIERHLTAGLILPRLMAAAVLLNLISAAMFLGLFFGGPIRHWACG